MENDLGSLMGFRDDFNGVGVFLKRNKQDGKFVKIIILNHSSLVFLNAAEQRGDTF